MLKESNWAFPTKSKMMLGCEKKDYSKATFIYNIITQQKTTMHVNLYKQYIFPHDRISTSLCLVTTKKSHKMLVFL